MEGLDRGFRLVVLGEGILLFPLQASPLLSCFNFCVARDFCFRSLFLRRFVSDATFVSPGVFRVDVTIMSRCHSLVYHITLRSILKSWSLSRVTEELFFINYRAYGSFRTPSINRGTRYFLCLTGEEECFLIV